MTRSAKPIRVGVIGAGYWGRNLLRNFAALGVLTAFCDRCERARAESRRIYPNASAYGASEDILSDSAVDAIVIATPAATHASLAAAALAAGKHVMVEKPLCLNPAEGRTLANDADRRGLTLMVGHLLLYHPAFRSLAAIVREGKLGKLRYIYSNRLSLGKIRREENALWSFAPHDISMILNLLGQMPHTIATSGGSYLHASIADTTLSHLTFPDGVQAHIFVSWLHPYKEHRLVVIGESGMAVFDDVQEGPSKLLFYPHAIGWVDDLPTISKADAVPIPYDNDEPLVLECQHFLDCVASRQRPTSDAEEGLRVLRVLNAGQESLLAGRPIRLDGIEP